MSLAILLCALVLLCFTVLSKLANQLRIPILLGFILFGLLFGNDPSMRLFFADYSLTETICSAALIIVMFYGGFGTNWKEAKKVAVPAGVLASFGTILTALLCGLFCFYALHMKLLEGMLVGALLSSTDAASVFSILRTQKLNLKGGTDSLLEVESGSNDPFAYMLMLVILTMMKGQASPLSIFSMLLMQIALGIGTARLVFFLSRTWKYISVQAEGFKTVFVLSLALLAYSLASLLQGNGYLAVYLFGLLLGNSKLSSKKELVHFFDGCSALMQMIIFFFLGLLAKPNELFAWLPISFCVFLFLTLAARPAAVFLLLSFFRQSFNQKALISFAGLRGAASIVFAIMATVDDAPFQSDVFHIVTGVVLFSLVIQGTLLPWASTKLNMVDAEHNVMKTFNDYSRTPDLQFSRIDIHKESPWIGQNLSDLHLPADMAVALIVRNQEKIVPDGATVIEPEDQLILTSVPFRSGKDLLDSEEIEGEDSRIGKSLSMLQDEIPKLICLGRNDSFLIPNGDTIIEKGDLLVFLRQEEEQGGM